MVFEEAVAEACAFCRAFNQAGDIGHDEAVVFIDAHDAQVWMQGGEGVVGDFGACGGYGGNQGGFTGVGHA